MKRQALDHTKMDLLMRRLKLPRWGCVGILESLWHLTAREAPRGDIGKLSDERIAIGIDWRGNANADASSEATRLVQALAEAGWLDADPTHRFVVHDWNEHADDAVKKYMKRNGLQWACLDMSRHVRTSLDMSRLPVPVPEPVPEPEGEQHTHLEAIVCEESPLREPPRKAAPPKPREIAVSSEKFSEWLKPWPRCSSPNAAAQAWLSTVSTEDEEAAAFSARDRYLASDEVSRNVVTEPGKFLFDQKREGWAGKWPAPRDALKLPPSRAEIRRAETIQGLKLMDQIRRNGSV